MNIIKNIYYFYLNGFRNMTLGKTLWKIIFVKILIIMFFINYFIQEKTFKSEYKTQEEKIDFVYKNLTNEKR